MFNYKFQKIFSMYDSTLALNLNNLYVTGLNCYGELGIGEDIWYEPNLVKTNITDIKKIAIGVQYTIILKNDGTLLCCGYNKYGQLGLGNFISTTGIFQPDICDVKDIICGVNNTFVIKNDGTIWVCGDNSYTKLGLESESYSGINTFTQFNIDNIKQISCGSNSTFILKNDGTLWSAGLNNNGQLGLGDKINRSTFTKVNIDNVKEVSHKGNHTLVLKNDGTLWSTGYNGDGQLGLGDNFNRSTFTKVNIDNVKEIAANYGISSIILKNDGTLWGCGDNKNGQLGLGNVKNKNTFTKITDNVKEVSSSLNNIFVLKNDGTLWGCGNNSYGELGLGDTIHRNTLTQIINADNVEKILNSQNHTLVLKNDGTLWACGGNLYGQLTFETMNKVRTFTKHVTDIKEVYINNENYMTFVLKNDGTLWASGANWNCGLGVNNDCGEEYEFVQTCDNVNKFYNNKHFDYNTLVLKNDGTLWVCGSNYCGEAATENLNEEEIWTYKKLDNIDMSNIKDIIVGNEATFFLKNDGTLWTCGYNGLGQLGVGNYDDVVTITQICDNVKEVAFGVYHTLVLKNDGTLWGCGDNSRGQLGLGSSIRDVTTLTQLGITNVKKIFCNWNISYAIKNDGTLWGTGPNAGGQLGLKDDKEHKYEFVQLIDNVNNFYYADNHSFVLKNDGTLWGCGFNDYGQLGLGFTSETEPWTQIPIDISNTSIKEVVAFDENSFIIMDDGTGYFTGNNSNGKTGCHPGLSEKNSLFTSFTKYEVPSKFDDILLRIDGELTEIDKGSSGEGHEVLLDKEKNAYVAGSNEYGQLGLGNYEDATDYTKLDIKDIKYIRAVNKITVIKKHDGKYYVAGRYIGPDFKEYKK